MWGATVGECSATIGTIDCGGMFGNYRYDKLWGNVRQL
jgi:hypothetical protein